MWRQSLLNEQGKPLPSSTKTMRQTVRKSNISVRIDRHCLEIIISGIVTARTLDSILKEMRLERERQEFTASDVRDLVVDLSNATMIELSGAGHLVCLCSALMTNKLKEIASPSTMYLRRPTGNVLTWLTRIGFFTSMSAKAKLLGHGELVHAEEKMRELSGKQAQAIASTWVDSGDRPIVWPIELVPHKEGSSAYRNFENACQYFLNHAHDQFDRLFSSSHFNFDRGDVHDFWNANSELYRNIFEHSDSWGLATIHARPQYGTVVCYYDIGIGIKGSVNASSNIPREFDTDYDAIKWALVEGHSSKIGGSGLGLNIVGDFVLSRDGTIELRSGQCLLQKRPGDTDWRAQVVPWFPGTQINFFVCVRT